MMHVIEHRARTNAQKKDVIKRLLALWLKNPNLRLSQLLGNLAGDNYSTEDFEYINRLENLYDRTPDSKL